MQARQPEGPVQGMWREYEMQAWQAEEPVQEMVKQLKQQDLSHL